MVYIEAEVFEPQAIYEIVYVPGIVIAIVIAFVLDRRYNTFFLVISYKIRGNPEDSRHVADLILQFPDLRFTLEFRRACLIAIIYKNCEMFNKFSQIYLTLEQFQG